jgi:hypothetical protein
MGCGSALLVAALAVSPSERLLQRALCILEERRKDER